MAIDPPEVSVVAAVFVGGLFVINSMRGHAAKVAFVLGIVISVLAGEIVAVLLSHAAPATSEPTAPAERNLKTTGSYNG